MHVSVSRVFRQPSGYRQVANLRLGDRIRGWEGDARSALYSSIRRGVLPEVKVARVSVCRDMSCSLTYATLSGLCVRCTGGDCAGHGILTYLLMSIPPGLQVRIH